MQAVGLILGIIQMVTQGIMSAQTVFPVLSQVVSNMQARIKAGQSEDLTAAELQQLRDLFTAEDGVFAAHIAAAKAAGR